MKPHRIIDSISDLFRSIFQNIHILGFFGITVAHTIFIIEIVELVGFNIFRIIFSIIAFANFSLLLLSIFQSYYLRAFGVAFYLLLLWSNALHFRFFGSTMHLGTFLNIGFLPVLSSQILLLI